MERKLSGLDVLFLAALLDQPLGQLGAFAISDHPTGHITTEYIQQDTTSRSNSISRGRGVWLYPSSKVDWEPWPTVPASGRADASTDRGAREPRLARRASDTWCELSSDIRLHRARSHKQRLENDLGNVLRVDELGPLPVPPGGVRVPAKAARTPTAGAAALRRCP